MTGRPLQLHRPQPPAPASRQQVRGGAAAHQSHWALRNSAAGRSISVALLPTEVLAPACAVYRALYQALMRAIAHTAAAALRHAARHIVVQASIAPLAAWAASPQAPAGGVQPVPTLTARVMDQTGTLTEAQRAALESKLADFEQTDGTQIVILLVPSTRPEDIAAYAQRVADSWKLGRRDVGDGLLIVVARNDRTVRIEVAKALEGAVPDLAARRVIDRAMVPAFQAGDTAGGLNAALDELFRLVRAEKLAPATRSNQSSHRGGDGLDWQSLALFLFVALPVLGSVLTAVFGRKLGSLASGMAMGGLGWLFSSSLLLALVAGLLGVFLVGALGVGTRRSGPVIGPWGAGWGGGSWGGGSWGGGGGFRSGGGGDFGGGGASGRW